MQASVAGHRKTIITIMAWNRATISTFRPHTPQNCACLLSSEIGFQVLSPSLEQQQNKAWSSQCFNDSRIKRAGGGSEGPYGNEKNGLSLKEERENSEAEKEHENGQFKLCSRGHWRPAEDAKLKDLVSLYGPQNWNLIAQKLEGRSELLLKLHRKSGLYHFNYLQSYQETPHRWAWWLKKEML